MTFSPGETEKEIFIKLLAQNESEEKDDVFHVVLHSPAGGAKLSKKKVILIQIVGNNTEIQKQKNIEELIKEMQSTKDVSWIGQFKQAVILSP